VFPSIKVTGSISGFFDLVAYKKNQLIREPYRLVKVVLKYLKLEPAGGLITCAIRESAGETLFAIRGISRRSFTDESS